MKVAAIQFRPTPRFVGGNLKLLAELVRRAARQGAEIIVLPELALSGYSMMSKAEAEPMAEVLSDFSPEKFNPKSSLSVFFEIAKLHKAYIAWGLVEKDPGTGNLHNSQVLMCPDGSYESYRKINFFGNDYLWATEGRANPPIVRIAARDGRSKTLGLLVCRDVRDKKDAAWRDFYEVGDADIVALSANWGKGAFPATSWIEFARDNKSTLIVGNRYGVETPNDFGDGGICVVTPDGQIQCEGLGWSEDCIVFGEV